MLDLGGGEERRTPTEELLDIAQRENRLPAALMEKMYDAGRYMFICSAGELMPNLQGIWTGSWTPAWSGDFTLDTNVQSAMTSACSANLPELMQGYFRLIESFYPEWRLNAKRIYGCRGYFSNARASNTCLLLHWGGWEGVFWTSGSGWLASFFTDYAAYTGDREFLARRCVPLLKEISAFYEDFLTETDKDGHVVFIPSYNPETGCGINATMDIAVAREVLSKLIAACRELKIEQENLPKWEALLAKLPPYPISDQGELAEWPGGGVSAGHRHHSQLYPCFQSLDPLLETDATLWKAAQATRPHEDRRERRRRRAIILRPRAVRRVGGVLGHVRGGLRPAEGHGGQTLDEREPDHLPRAQRRHLQHGRQRRHPAHRRHDARADPRPASSICCRPCLPRGPPARLPGCAPAAISPLISNGKTAKSSATASLLPPLLQFMSMSTACGRRYRRRRCEKAREEPGRD